MDISTIPSQALVHLLQDVAKRDLPLRRQMILLRILLNEGNLNRPQLISRTESFLEPGCFGSAWEDAFYRDMRVVKESLLAAGFYLRYSRSRKRPGYYLAGQPALSDQLTKVIHYSVAEVDRRQIQIFRSMSPAERFHLGCSVTDLAMNTSRYRKNPAEYRE